MTTIKPQRGRGFQRIVCAVRGHRWQLLRAKARVQSEDGSWWMHDVGDCSLCNRCKATTGLKFEAPGTAVDSIHLLPTATSVTQT